jgi:hypothetical protein
MKKMVKVVDREMKNKKGQSHDASSEEIVYEDH